MKKVAVSKWDDLDDRSPTYALLADVDLVIVRYDDQVSVLYGRCAHRGALMADLTVDDLTTFDANMAQLNGVAYGGVTQFRSDHEQ